MNPMRGVHALGSTFGSSTNGLDRANRYVSEEEGVKVSIRKELHGTLAKATEPMCTGCRRRRATTLVAAVKSPTSLYEPTSGRSWSPARDPTFGSQRDTL